MGSGNTGGSSMSKPFFYKLVAADFLAEVCEVPESERGLWVRTLALDLTRGKGSTEYARSLIEEAKTFQKRKADAGRAGGLAKASRAKDKFSKS